jgi:hypothetical protein
VRSRALTRAAHRPLRAQAALQVARLTLLEAEKRLKGPREGSLAPEAFDVSYGWCALRSRARAC